MLSMYQCLNKLGNVLISKGLKLNSQRITFLLLFVGFSTNLVTAQEQNPEWRYSVRKGDTLIDIAKRYLKNPEDWQVLQKINKIKNPRDMHQGKVILIPLNALKQTPAPAEIVLVSGFASIKTSTNVTQDALVGSLLNAGTLISTGKNSKINLKFADGSIVTLESNSSLILDTLSIFGGGGMVDTKLRLQQGKVEVLANPMHSQMKMQIHTPTAVAAVRGTEFRVSTDGSIARQETLHGKVVLSAAGKNVGVAKGYGSLSENSKPPLAPVLLLDAPDTSNLPSQLSTLPLKFEFPVQQNAKGYIAKLSSDPQFDTILTSNLEIAALAIDHSVKTNQVLFDDLPDGKYFLKVRAKDEKGLEGYDATHTFTLNVHPIAPDYHNPASNAIIRTPSPTLAWNKSAEAKTYLVEIAKDSKFNQVVDQFVSVNNEYTLTKELTPGQYFWRLASIDGVDQGPYAKADSFIYKSKPSAPNIEHFKYKVINNRVFVSTINPPDKTTYSAALSNTKNNQKNVWVGQGLSGEFSFLLREFGQQSLAIKIVESDGVTGSESLVKFIVLPQ